MGLRKGWKKLKSHFLSNLNPNKINLAFRTLTTKEAEAAAASQLKVFDIGLLLT
jgi:hypothetical protein